MTRVFATAVAIAIACFGYFFITTNEIAKAVTRLETRVDERFVRVDERFDAVDRRFTSVDGHFDHVYSRLDRLETEYTSITAALKRLER